MEATRQLFWNTGGEGIMYFCAFISILIFVIGFAKKFRNWQQGRRICFDNISLRVRTFFIDVIKHDKNIFKGTFRRLMHSGIFYGFIVLLIGTSMIAIQVDFKIPLFFGIKYLVISLLMDIFGLLAMVGIGMAAYKRYIAKRDYSDYTLDDAILLILVFIILLTGFILEGLRIYVNGDIWARWTPVGLFFSVIVQISGLSVQSARSLHAGLWYFHMLLAFGFIAYIPYSKLFHMFASSLNIFLKPSSALGALTTVDIINDQVKDFGVNCLEDFTHKQLIELDACVSCLRCQKGCPAYASGAPLSPRRMIHSLKRHSSAKNSFFQNKNITFHNSLVDKIISKETLWSCTTCGLCESKCPVSLEHIKRIVDLRRGLTTKEDGYPQEVQRVFESVTRTGNPWGLGIDSKHYLANGAEVPLISEKKQTDILYWVGCYGTFDSRNQKVSQIMFKLLDKAGLDYAILGREEKCCGSSIRRLGNEKLFQQLAMENIRNLNQYKFKTIVTNCPHCLHSLKNDYPQFGGFYHVMHHSELMLELIKSGQLVPRKTNNYKVTFHDPCYLGRYNSLYEAPRAVLTSIPGVELVEMKNNQAKGFCCGAGGGRIWIEDTKEEKINNLLLKKALKTEADVLASACSLCLSSITEAAANTNKDIASRDIAELIYDAL